jgi:hypothetical protein
MKDLIKDKVLVVFDEEIKSLMSTVDYKELFDANTFNDDVYQDQSKIKQQHPFEWAVFNNFWILVGDKYIKPAFPNHSLEVAEIKLAEGYSKSNFKWHTDKDGALDCNEKPNCDQDIIVLYYFNDTDFGPLCVKHINEDDSRQTRIFPKKGMTVILNEYHPGLVHKVEKYDLYLGRRFTARVSFRIKG